MDDMNGDVQNIITSPFSSHKDVYGLCIDKDIFQVINGMRARLLIHSTAYFASKLSNSHFHTDLPRFNVSLAILPLCHGFSLPHRKSLLLLPCFCTGCLDGNSWTYSTIHQNSGSKSSLTQLYLLQLHIKDF